MSYKKLFKVFAAIAVTMVMTPTGFSWGAGSNTLRDADFTSSRPSTRAKFDAILNSMDAYEKAINSSFWRFEFKDADGDYDRNVVTIIRDQKSAQSAYQEIGWRGDKIAFDQFFVDRGSVCFSVDRILGKGFTDVDSSGYPQTARGNYLFGPIGEPGKSFRSRIGSVSHHILFESVTTPSLLILASAGVKYVFDESRGYYPVLQGVYFGDQSEGKFFETIEAKNLVQLSTGQWWPKSWTISSGKLAQPSGAWEMTRELNYDNVEIELSADRDVLQGKIRTLAPPPCIKFINRATGAPFKNIESLR